MRHTIVSVLILLMLVLPVRIAAQDHVVGPAELQEALASAAEARKNNVRTVNALFDSEMGRAALGLADIELEEVDQAVAALGDEQLERLAARVAKTQTDLVAGELDNQQITYILIALAAAVIVLVLK